jgi:signal transduction histidine kinase
MNGILGFLELLTEPDIDEGQKEIYLDIMNKSGQRLLDTINDIVELAKIESGQLDVANSKVDLYELMNYHFSFFTLKAESQKLGLGLDYQVPVNMSIVELDKISLTAFYLIY